MEFDKSKGYTALNADELEPGDVVFVADTLAELKQTKTAYEIKRILGESAFERFVVKVDSRYTDIPRYALAYLIAKHDDPYKEFKKAQAEGKEVWYKNGTDSWMSGCNWGFNGAVGNYSLTNPVDKYYCFLAAGTLVRFVYGDKLHTEDRYVFAKFDSPSEANGWCTKHQKFAEVAKAWLNGKTIEFRSSAIKEWTKIAQPDWNINTEYRVAPEEVSWEDFKLFDKVECRGFKQFVSGINPTSPQYHIQLSVSGWLEDDELKYVKELED